jgi:hypothetical protein
MADLTRERLAEIRANVASVADGGDEAVHLAPGEWEALLSMASRCVSEETVRKLAEAAGYAEEAFQARQGERYHDARAANDQALDAAARFAEMARRDLREAALDGEGAREG